MIPRVRFAPSASPSWTRSWLHSRCSSPPSEARIRTR